MFSLNLYVKSRNQPQKPPTALEKGDARVKDLALLTLALFVGGMALTIYGSPFTPRYNHAPCAKGYIMVVLGAVAFTSSLPLGMITLVMAMIQGENRTKKRNEGLPLQDPVKGGE